MEKIDPDSGNKGFRFVWDFGTDRISSETEPSVIISSLALTSPRAGDANLFSETKLTNSSYDYTYGGYSAPGNKAGKYLKDANNDPAIAFTIASTKGYDSITYLGCFDGINHLYVNWNNTVTSSNVPLVSSGQLTFKKFIPFPKNNIKLTTTNNIYENGEKTIDIRQIMTLKGISAKYPPNFTIDTTNGYKMYLFSNLNGSGTAEWKIACINLVSLELEWSATIPSNILPLTNSNSVYIGYYDNKILYKAATDTSIHYCPVEFTKGESNLIKTREQGEYNIQKYASKLIAAPTTPIFTLIKDKTLHLTYDTYRYVLMSDKEHPQSIFYCLGSKLDIDAYGRECYCNDNNFPNVFLSRQDCSSNSASTSFSLDVYAAVDDYYLATINNLDEEIEKTPSLSLKVQYDLIEV